MASVDGNGDIAVVGMACRVAGANSPSELWDVLAHSRDVQSRITRFNTEGFYHPFGGPRKGSTNVQHAYMLKNEVIDKFDHAFFHITPVEAMAIDPQQRMLLEVAYEAIENAGVRLEDFMGTDTAVMAGVESCDYYDVISRDIDATPRYLATGTPMCMAANRISYFFNLSGPSIAMDTACSSTMVALHQAVRALKYGDSGMALVCGAKLIITPNMFVPSAELGFLSPGGRSRSFDANGDGYGRGEGVIALLLKPYTTAVADGDTIRAVIKGTRLNQDGRTQGITLPSADAQRDNMKRLYSEIGISSSDIQYLEAHGTGTAGGDRLEFSAINAVLSDSDRSQQLVVGALKSCIGHLEACAGLASVVKTVECLERGQIPPQMHFSEPNPKIDFRDVVIPRTMLEWPTAAGQVRRAAINTFGAGGTNAHAVLESYSRQLTEALPSRKTYLFMVSAADDDALNRLSLKYADYVEQSRPELHNLAHTLLACRSKLSRSIFFAANNHAEVILKLRSQALKIHSTQSRSNKAVVCLFTGQGAQWPTMGKALIEQSPLFEGVLLKCDEILANLPERPSWSIVDELRKEAGVSNLYKSLYSQALCTALQLGIVILLRSWGIVPAAVVGHSSGEIAAAYSAGLVSFEHAIIVAYYRGLFLDRSASDKSQRSAGGMCAIGMSRSDTLRFLEGYKGRIELAAANSPSSCTLSGDIDAIEEIERHCVQNATLCRRLRVDMAYHSHHVVPVAAAYERALEIASIADSAHDCFCDMFSSVTGRKLTAKEVGPSYWKNNMTSTVQFDAALTACVQDQLEDFIVLEIGPHPALKAPAVETMQYQERKLVNYFNSIFRKRNDMEALLENVGDMIASGIAIEERNINGKENARGIHCTYEFPGMLKDLPSYQWDHSTPLWYEARSSRNQRFRRFPRHQFLGSRYLEDSPSNPSWRSLLNLDDVPWLAALKSKGATTLPAATFILMAAEAARQIFVAEELIAGSIEMFRFSFHGPLSLSLFDTAPGLEFHLIAQLTDQANHFNFHILYLLSGKKDSSERLCSGSFRWTDASRKKGGNGPHPLDCDNDPWLLEHSQVSGYRFSPSIFDLRLNSRSSSGAFECLSDPLDHSWIDPGTLHSILELASISNIQYGPPSVQKVASIASLTFPLQPTTKQKNGRFTTEVRSASLSMMKVNIGISFDEHCGISFADICFANEKVIEQAPASRSLFFNPVILPDITRLRPSAIPMDLSECLKLVTHKWPMSDVAITGLMDQDTQSVLDSVRAASCGGRSHFRSMTIVGNAELELASSKIRSAEKLGDDHRFHLLFQGMNHTASEEACNQVLPGGIFGVHSASEEQSNRLCQSFTKLCDLTGFKGRHVWSIWRRHRMSHSEQQSALNSRLTLFGSNDNFTLLGGAFPEAERVLLAPTGMKNFFDSKRLSTEKSDAIIFDHVENSIITTWTGTELVPWLQVLLTSYENIIWVTLESWNRNPHHGVAGNLLRSLQAEQPSLRTAWLMFEKLPVAEISEMISSVYQDLKSGRGENEVVLEVTNSGSRILRYLPDDRLSVSAGVALPRNEIKSNLAGNVYEISFARPAPIALVWIEHARTPLDSDKARVKIEASVIDLIDVLALGSTTKFSPLPCKFFAGQVVDGGQTEFAVGTKVLGWYKGQHRSQADISSSCLHSYNASSSPAASATKFASLCIALCILDGVARARKGDTFNIRLEGFLGEAVTKLCTKFGAESYVAESEGSATFTVECSIDRGLVVNNTTLEVEEYLSSTRGSDTLSHYWKDAGAQDLLPKAFKLSEIQQHLPKLESLDAYSTVIDLIDTDNANGVIVNRRSGALFSNVGTYVVVGGLGGLGRFLCSWMVENGAGRLVVISRNGLRSQEAKKMYSALRSSGVSMEVMKADACDRAAMQEALSQIRRDSPIKGLLNLAMVLEDSQFASMTGEQWDGAVGLKQKSSWILHEETMTDQLDFFILFSSIASVLGNRGQGNYNIGNTFLNALARYRRFIGLTAVSIALGAMTEIGVLHDLGKEDLVGTLTRSGLSPLGKKELAKIMEAAVLESRRSDRSLIVTGLEMFDRLNGTLVGSRDQTQLFWTELPEFGFLQNHRLSDTDERQPDTKRSLREKALLLPEQEAQEVLQEAFIDFLSQLLGFPVAKFQATSSFAAYGLDSLSAVSCQYWLHRNLSVNIPIAKIFDAPSIAELVKQIWDEMMGHDADEKSA